MIPFKLKIIKIFSLLLFGVFPFKITSVFTSNGLIDKSFIGFLFSLLFSILVLFNSLFSICLFFI